MHIYYRYIPSFVVMLVALLWFTGLYIVPINCVNSTHDNYNGICIVEGDGYRKSVNQSNICDNL